MRYTTGSMSTSYYYKIAFDTDFYITSDYCCSGNNLHKGQTYNTLACLSTAESGPHQLCRDVIIFDYSY